MAKKSTRRADGADVLVPGYQRFGGQSEAAPLCGVLAHAGVTAAHTGEPFSEALLFGIGGGIGAGYFVYASADFLSLFIATRITGGPDFVPTIARRLGLKTESQSSSAPAPAQKKLKQALTDGRPVIAWVDPRLLPYYATPAAYHTLVVYGLDQARDRVLVADRYRKGLTLAAAQLSKARKGEGVKNYAALLVKPGARKSVDARTAVKQGLRACCDQMITGFGPPNLKRNFGLHGLLKWADLLTDAKDQRGWPKFFPPGPRLYQALTTAYDQIENRGGGSAYRPLYADFLDEAGTVLGQRRFKSVATQFRESAAAWGALGKSLLPNAAPQLKEARQFLNKRRALFEKKGLAAAGEARAVAKRLDKLQAQAAKKFPLAGDEVADLLARVRERVLAVHALEERAVRDLQALVR